MKQFKRISILIILSVFFISIISCSKEDKSSIYLDIAGIWESDADGSPTLYLISNNEDYHIYTHTYPYPIAEIDVDSGWFNINEQASTIVFTNSITNNPKSYKYKLSNKNSTLTLDDMVYKRVIEN